METRTNQGEAAGCMECVTHYNPVLRRYGERGQKIDAPASEMRYDARLEATILGPGKFEGEILGTYHAYHIMLDGFEDDSNGPYWRVGNTICFERDTGFVDGEHFESETEAQKHWTSWIENLCFDEMCEEEHGESGEHVA